MAKRFTDTEKYKKKFFRSLPAAYKLFWDYIYHDCNHAGLWIVDFDIAQLYIGKDAVIDYDKAIELFNKKKTRIIEIGADYWFVPSFIKFQYGEKVSKTNNVWKSIEKILDKYDLYKYLNVEVTEEGETTSAKRNRIGKVTKQKILFSFDLVCQYCQITKTKDELVVDHIIPLNKNGTNDDDNLVCACIRCNSKKTDLDPEDFINRDYDFLNPTKYLKGAIKKLKGGDSVLIVPKDKELDKDKDKDKELEKETGFDDFWNRYQKKGNKKKALAQWKKLKKSQIEEIWSNVDTYLLNTQNLQFRKNAETYLNPNNEHWNDEIVFKQTSQELKEDEFKDALF